MKALIISIAAAMVAAATAFQFANAASLKPVETKSLDALALQVTSGNASKSTEAIKQLRAAGSAGLDAMFRLYGDRINAQQTHPNPNDSDWQSIRSAFDTIGQQRDCYASHLYWFTDLEQAKAAAKASGKPILSLRLLGKLNEEYSCANSRFFRTTLYPNTEVSQYLRDHVILHWQSVRPVPRITIDMGDGRRIERTITGNSIHYVLDTDGNPIDALPGLYGAKAFITELNRAVAAEQQSLKLNGAERAAFLKNYHSTRLAEIQDRWAADLARVSPTPTPAVTLTRLSTEGGPPDAVTAARITTSKNTIEIPMLLGGVQTYTASIASLLPNSPKTPDAIAAVPIAISKSGIERPLLRAGAQTAATTDRERLDARSNDSVWKAIAALHREDATIDSATYTLIQFKQPPTAVQATVITASKRAVESPMARMVRNLQQSIAEDTVRNEYQIHSRIHEWFANGTAPANLNALNAKIYAELFLTPDSDAWLGLAPNDVFSALDGGGLVQNTTTH